MNVEIRTEAAQFPEKEYISGIFLAVWEIRGYIGQHKKTGGGGRQTSKPPQSYGRGWVWNSRTAD
jgi:hypothetical protein